MSCRSFYSTKSTLGKKRIPYLEKEMNMLLIFVLQLQIANQRVESKVERLTQMEDPHANTTFFQIIKEKRAWKYTVI